MAYRYDSDLEFLRELKSEQLNELVGILLKASTNYIEIDDEYKLYSPDHHRYIDIIMADLQSFGGNSFVNLVRGGGVRYREILFDVCDQIKVNYNKNSLTENIEANLFMKILTDSLDKLNESELKEISNEFGLKTTSFTKQGVTIAIQALMKAGGFTTYKIALIVANAVVKAVLGTGLSLASNAALSRSIALFIGPVGWVITGLWTAIDIAGPAYRVTIPAVIQVAYLRQLYLNKDMKD